MSGDAERARLAQAARSADEAYDIAKSWELDARAAADRARAAKSAAHIALRAFDAARATPPTERTKG